MGIFDWLKGKKKDNTASRRVTSGQAARARAEAGTFDPGSDGVELVYKNFRGETKTLVVDGHSAYRFSDRIRVKAAPTGARLTLWIAKIQNWNEISGQIKDTLLPEPNERRILNFHFYRGTTSAQFEELRSKYPDYDPR